MPSSAFSSGPLSAVSIMHLERLLVSLVGHMTKGVRERATVLLNMLYDGTDWQLVPHSPTHLRPRAPRVPSESTPSPYTLLTRQVL